MEFRDAVLQNEIDHLGKNFRLLSAELLLIQEFVKEEFGSKFLAFCNARREQRRPLFSKSSMDNPSPRKATSTAGVVNYSNEIDETFGTEEEPCIIPDGLHDSDSDGSEPEYDPMSLVELETEYSEGDGEIETKPIPNLNLPNENMLNQTEGATEGAKKGRPKSLIHRYYEKIKTDDGKWKDRCYTCGNFVSSKAPRLKKHLLKCRGKDSKVMHIINKLEAAKYTPSSKNFKVMQVLTKLDVKYAPVINSNRLGRKMDIVRLAFQEIKDSSGYNKMKCMNCGELVSNKPSRMRNHLSRCTGESTTPDMDLGPDRMSTVLISHSIENKKSEDSENSDSDGGETSQTKLVLPSSSTTQFLPSESSAAAPEEINHNGLPPSLKQNIESMTRSMYPNSSHGHVWTPAANDMESFTEGPISYLILPPPGNAYQHH